MKEELEQLRSEYAKLCAAAELPTAIHFSPQHDGSAHVEFDGSGYSYVVTERGSEFERRCTKNRDELLYWLVADAVFDVACAFEARHRIAGQDFRRLFFSKELELLAAIRPEWARRKRAEIEKVLESNPYNDELG